MCGDSVPERFSLFASILTKLLLKRYPDDRLCHTIANAEVDNSRHLSSPAATRTRSNLSPSAVSARHRRHRWLNKQRRDLDSGVYSVSVFMPDRSRQCRINNGANGAAAPGPPQLGAPHKGFCY